jgi:hypothetical protein
LFGLSYLHHVLSYAGTDLSTKLLGNVVSSVKNFFLAKLHNCIKDILIFRKKIKCLCGIFLYEEKYKEVERTVTPAIEKYIIMNK